MMLLQQKLESSEGTGGRPAKSLGRKDDSKATRKLPTAWRGNKRGATSRSRKTIRSRGEEATADR